MALQIGTQVKAIRRNNETHLGVITEVDGGDYGVNLVYTIKTLSGVFIHGIGANRLSEVTTEQYNDLAELIYGI
jgi:hypothetical protein